MVLQDDAVLPPRQKVNVTARSPFLAPHLVDGDCIIDSCQVRPGVYVSRTLLPAGHRDLMMRMVNTTSKPLRLTNGTC